MNKKEKILFTFLVILLLQSACLDLRDWMRVNFSVEVMATCLVYACIIWCS